MISDRYLLTERHVEKYLRKTEYFLNFESLVIQNQTAKTMYNVINVKRKEITKVHYVIQIKLVTTNQRKRSHV